MTGFAHWSRVVIMATSTTNPPSATERDSGVVVGHELTRRFGVGDAAVDALRGVTVGFRPGTFTAIMTQVRRVVRYESVITSVIGGVLGTIVGVLFAALAMTALADLGLSFALPATQLAAFLVLAMVVGMAAAVVPARRAAAVDVLEAMRHD
jgi:hypothetical protein